MIKNCIYKINIFIENIFGDLYYFYSGFLKQK